MGDTRPVTVLLVDDDPGFVDIASTFLERESDRIETVTATSVNEGLDALASERIDCVVSDYEMPEGTGLDFLETIRERRGDMPFILCTGRGSEEIASDAISAGVTDYIQKESGTELFAVLANRIEHVVEGSRSQQTLAERTQRLETLISNLPGMVYRCENDPAWPMVIVEGECEALTGYPSSALESNAVVWGEEVLHPGDRDEMWNEVQEAVEAREPFEVTYRIRTANGETKWVWERGRGIYEDGEIESLEGFITDISARKGRERELRRYESMVDTMEESACIYDQDGRYETVNDHLAEWYDTTPDALKGQQSNLVRDISERSDGEPFEALLNGELAELEGETEAQFPGHGHAIVNYRLTPLRVDGDIEGVVAVARDVTEYRKREAELEQTNAVLSTLIDTLPLGVLAEDESREVMAVNDRLFSLFEMDGTPADVQGADCEAMAKAVSDMFADPAGFVERIETLIAEREPVHDERLRLADGRTFERSYQPIELPDGDGHLWVYRDVSDRVDQERTLRRQETFLQNSPDVFLLVDEDGTIRYQNHASEALLGYPMYDFEGKEAIDYVHPDDRASAWDDFQTLLENPNEPIISEFRLELPTGEWRWFENHAINKLEDPSVEGVLVVNRDITERKESERRLEEQNERLEEFASVVSHDLRNPLHVAQGHIELATTDREDEHLDKAQRALERCQRLIDTLLTLARGDEPITDLETVELESVVEQCWRNVETKEATIDVEGELTMRANPSRLQQLLENLFRNAVEHAGPAVTVTVGELADGFYVADDGPGIPETERQAVFDVGYSTDEEGTGFGLNIVDRIVEAHDWQVRLVESDRGGARFEITGVESESGEN